jgi:hypothetical protein
VRPSLRDSDIEAGSGLPVPREFRLRSWIAIAGTLERAPIVLADAR